MKNKSVLIRILGVIVVTVIGIIATYRMTLSTKSLKVYNPSDINPKLVDPSLQQVKKMHRISDFRLVNQEGDSISQENFREVVYVADFFFTTCKTICPKMTTQMQRVYDAFGNNDQVKLLSHTVYPEIDSVAVLAEYAGRYHADPKKWQFATGNKKHIYDLARKSYFAVTTEGSGDEDDFIHTENFILVDKEKRIRGFYDGTSEKDVDRLIDEIDILLNEYRK